MGNHYSYFIRLFILIFSMKIISSMNVHGQVQNFRQYFNSDIENSETYIVGNTYQKDFLYFIDILDKCHPVFASGMDHPFDLDSIKQMGYQSVAQFESRNDLWSYMQAIATRLHDGHTTLQPEINMNLIYPFICFFDEANIHLMGVNQEYKSSLGKQIVQINGLLVWEVVNKFKQLISSDNENYFKDKVNTFMQLYSMWQLTPHHSADSTITLTFADATSVSMKPISKKQLNIVWQSTQKQSVTIRKKSKAPFHYTLLPEKSMCYFQFNTCFDQSTLRMDYMQSTPNISAKELDAKTTHYPRFDTFIKDMFDTIRVNKIETLVIDVRNNAGGNSKLCDVLLSWLKPVKEIKNIRSKIRFSELWKIHYPALASEYEQVFLETGCSFEMGKVYDNYSLSYMQTKSSIGKETEYFIMNNDEEQIFDGKVIFIQNSKTHSSAGMLITTAMDNNIGTVIGKKSSYKPCSYGDLLGWTLPNTKIKGFVSHKIFTRPDVVKCNENYLSPTVYLSPKWIDVLSGRDIYWEWVVSNYGK